MLGYGSPYGLLNPSQFIDAGSNIIDESMVPALRNKIDNLYTWCYADQFVRRHGLSGLCSGVFISELIEAEHFGFDDLDQNLIDKSTERFASISSKYITGLLDAQYFMLLLEYGVVARNNLIARFNLERMYLLRGGTNNKLIKEAV